MLSVPNAPGAYSPEVTKGFNPKDMVIDAGGSPGQGPTSQAIFNARDVNRCSPAKHLKQVPLSPQAVATLQFDRLRKGRNCTFSVDAA